MCDIQTIANEVVYGKWGYGETRKKALEEAGYNYTDIQKEIQKLLDIKINALRCCERSS